MGSVRLRRHSDSIQILNSPIEEDQAMPRTKGAKNRTLREITKDSAHAIERKRLKDENARLKTQAKDADKRAKVATRAAAKASRAK